MKHIQLFESYDRYGKYLEQIKNCKIGDILSEDVIYMYVEYLNNNSNIHSHDESFIDGDLGDRIEEYSNYKYELVPIGKIDLDEWDLYEDEITIYANKLKETNYYPPIVLDSNYGIIDGIHRANALNELGYKEILAFVGI